MSGGFDLDEIASNLSTGVGRRPGRRERNDFNRASSDVQKAEGKQAALQRDADRLESLQARFDEAEASARRLVHVERALGLAGRLEEHAGIAAEIAALPEALGKLTGKEVEQVEQLKDQVRTRTERARTLETKLSEAKNAQTDSGLSVPLDEAELAAWRARADELSRVELELEAARTEHNACRKELRAALSAIGDGNVDEVALDLSDHGRLFEFLRASEAHKGRVGSIEERLRLLDRVERHGDGQRDLEKLRGATESLRSWLREPAPENAAGQDSNASTLDTVRHCHRRRRRRIGRVCRSMVRLAGGRRRGDCLAGTCAGQSKCLVRRTNGQTGGVQEVRRRRTRGMGHSVGRVTTAQPGD